MPFVQLQLLLERSRPRRNEPLLRGASVAFEVLDIAADRGGRLGRGVGEIAEQMQIAQIAERPRQIFVDEAQRAAHAFEADLDEDARRILDVVARGLDEARHLAKLRQDAPRPFGERRVVEQRLTGEAGRQDVGVMLRIPLPRTDLLEIEQRARGCWRRAPAARAARFGQTGRIDRRQPPREPAKVPNLRLDRLTAQSSSRSSWRCTPSNVALVGWTS